MTSQINGCGWTGGVRLYSVGVFISVSGRVIKRTMSLLQYLQRHSSLPILIVVSNIIHSSCDNLVEAICAREGCYIPQA